eukprot:CAMPEP_0175619104 /NCGR_PEP_ID=MMETSP0096-20121207/67239_1 /TAXON_ID=311494 /ORGANISM="Alexandrium monilatum, Strain CCMP3105" /LENGTH=94 /DNA_ID=CAMNT_0016924315 /DNA_START=205 /DNA_END=487 /DNA_ORIENTATION=-
MNSIECAIALATDFLDSHPADLMNSIETIKIWSMGPHFKSFRYLGTCSIGFPKRYEKHVGVAWVMEDWTCYTSPSKTSAAQAGHGHTYLVKAPL